MWFNQMLPHYPGGFHFRAANHAGLLLKPVADA